MADLATVCLSGKDIEAFEKVLAYYPKMSRSGVLRELIRDEAHRIQQENLSTPKQVAPTI